LCISGSFYPVDNGEQGEYPQKDPKIRSVIFPRSPKTSSRKSKNAVVRQRIDMVVILKNGLVNIVVQDGDPFAGRG